LDTNQDKGIEKKQATKETEETKATEEAIEPKEGEEEQPVTEEETEGPEEELIETAPKEEAEEAEKVEGVAEEAAPEVEEEEKKEKRKKEAEEEEIVEERIYTIPLRRVWISPRKKRAPRAVRVVESFIQRHMKVETGTKADEEEEEARLIISNEVNEKLWSRGIEKPPRNIRVRAVKDKEGTVTVYLAEGD
jgi:large subunit ribosomal protein L31e